MNKIIKAMLKEKYGDKKAIWKAIESKRNARVYSQSYTDKLWLGSKPIPIDILVIIYELLEIVPEDIMEIYLAVIKIRKYKKL